ncbi:hypothetical protein CLV92_1323 [Kineococcus xinjiangensis]|uniref:Uncharacterized protein n=1 Tax=Kineococcus xinjiangensis TaxID=512762 RepID=A0A2S6IBT1_9ACTN|nr:hypothetical protein [Kineococcus xinjiangensis]PPK89807.1 hypothetical protein CLV92_1323 [Kineococcus xinjiangensis]
MACPYCSARGNVQELDRAERVNEAIVTADEDCLAVRVSLPPANELTAHA